MAFVINNYSVPTWAGIPQAGPIGEYRDLLHEVILT